MSKDDEKKAALRDTIALADLTLIPSGLFGTRLIIPGSTALSRSAVVGRDVEKTKDVAIGEAERCGGLYVLGQPRTGKSNLLISLALSDIQNGHGILFIDPHTDAINDLVCRIPKSRREDIILLDPTDKTRSFGINPLHCTDPTDPIELDNTVGRVLDIFAKVWGDQTTGRLGIWLEKILANAVYLLLENPDPGYTLVDIPALLWEDTTFRNELLRHVKVKSSVPDFWVNEFDRLTRRDKTEQVGPALSRLDIFRRNDMVRGIVGQKTPKLDFAEILKEKKIVLLRMPVNLSGEVKNLIGTMLLSELLYAVFERAQLAEKERPFFGIYCDEFQEFATPDFARLFTQTGKYKVMPVVAHQTRLGQFKPGDPNQGATLDSPNKVLFALSSYDARELALDFAREPPTETRLEEQYAISQNPVPDLLHGHKDSDIRRFVNKYLRFLVDKRDDIKADMEGEKFARMVALDTAAIYGAEAQGEGVLGGSHYTAQLEDVYARRGALSIALMHSSKLVALHKQGNRIRVTLRELNRFLTEVMEGEKRAEKEAFSDFLISLAAGYSALPEAYAEVLGLYIEVSYGDPGKPRTIPFDLARSQSLFSKEVSALTFQAEKKTEEERRDFQAKFIPEEEQDRAHWRKSERESKPRDRLRALEGKIGLRNRRCSDIGGGRTGTRGRNMICREDFIWYPANVYTWFIWLRLFPDIEKLLIPYRTAKFTEAWEYLMSDGQAAKTIAKLDESLNLVKPWEYGSEKYMEYMRARVARDLKDFLHRYQEGALVMLALLDCAGKGGWRGGQDSDISLTEFPVIEGKDPVEVWCLIERLRVAMREALGERKFSSVFSKYLEGYNLDDDNLYWAGFQTSIPSYTDHDDIRYRKDVQALETLLSERWSWLVRHNSTAAEWWKKSSASVRCYLLCRAADQLSFGDKYSSLPRAAFAPYEEVVSALVWLSKDTKARLDEAEEKEAAARERQRIEKECAEKVGKISVSPPATLEPRVLDASQRRTVRQACMEEIKDGPQVVYEVAATIDEFASFCVMLAKPENHIKVRSGQYVEKQVPMRQESDMVNEMARVLTGLPRYSAYARIVEEKGGEPIVWKGRIQTAKLDDVMSDAMDAAREAIEKNALRYCRMRQEIEQEIKGRQERWRPRVRVEAPSVHTQETKKPALPSGPRVSEPDEPPPTSVSVKKAGDKPEKTDKPVEAQRVSQDAATPESFTVQKPARLAADESPKARLVYSSDFTKPTGWDERHSDKVKVFIINGYYHIGVYDAPYYAYFAPPLILEDFKAQVDAEFNLESGKGAECGFVFCERKDGARVSFYTFVISSRGSCRLVGKIGEEWQFLIDQKSVHIKPGDNTNALMVEKIGTKVTVEINGAIISSVTDAGLSSGKVGLFVRAATGDSCAVARFGNFRVYRIEN